MILTSCYGTSALEKRLHDLGVPLFHVTTRKGLAAQLPYPSLEVEYPLIGWSELSLPDRGAPTGLPRLLDLERRWMAPPAFNPELSARGASQCRSFYLALLERLQPSAFLVFNTNLPHSIIARQAAVELGVTTYAYEQGILPKTVAVDGMGLGLSSELGASFALDKYLREHKTDWELLYRYRAWHSANRANKHQARSSLGDLRSQIGTDKASLILNSVANLDPYPDVARIVSKRSGAFLYRDHPINLHHRLPIPDGCISAQGGTLLDVLEIADHVIALGYTTAVFEAMLIGKTVECLGGWWPFGLGLFQLEHGWPPSPETILSFGLTHATSWNPEVPVGRPLAELAEFLRQRSCYHDPELVAAGLALQSVCQSSS